MFNQLRQLFGRRPTTKGDVILAFAAAGMAVIHAIDVKQTYTSEQNENQETAE